jgi:hypothetical protein
MLPQEWNLDHLWLRKPELVDFVAPSRQLGGKRHVPPDLIRRLARLHFLDNVRGVADPFEEDNVTGAHLETLIVGTEKSSVTLGLRGATRAEAQGRWAINWFEDPARPSPQVRGVEVELRGLATYDIDLERFTAFEMVAIGNRWGGGRYNYRADDLGVQPIGFYLSLAKDTPVDRIEPAYFARYGWTDS